MNGLTPALADSRLLKVKKWLKEIYGKQGSGWLAATK
jgi:hypothetical protein